MSTSSKEKDKRNESKEKDYNRYQRKKRSTREELEILTEQVSSGYRSGHLEVQYIDNPFSNSILIEFVSLKLNSLYTGISGHVKVNAMNAPNNSTMQVLSLI